MVTPAHVCSKVFIVLTDPCAAQVGGETLAGDTEFGNLPNLPSQHTLCSIFMQDCGEGDAHVYPATGDLRTSTHKW